MRIEHLYRYPVKGLSAEALEAVDLVQGEALPWDRAFALAQGDAPFDPAQPVWIKKTHFMCLMANARIAGLKSQFDPVASLLTIQAPDGSAVSANPLHHAGQASIAAFLTGFLGDEARGQPVFHHIPGFVFGDQKTKAVSLINLASLADYEQRQGAERHRLRFRANIYFSGAAPWAEHDWIDRELLVGGARLAVFKRTVRCPATEVNPQTATRDANPVRELLAQYGHSDLGVHAHVIQGGRIAMGDAIELV